VNAVALDTSDPAMQEAVVNAGLRCVIVDAISSRPDLDVVLQDNHEGARMAVRHLLSRGHKRIGWLGPTRGYVHWSERFGGAREGLWTAGLDFAREDILQPENNDAREEAALLLKRRMEAPGAPAAWVCLWQKMVLAAGDVRQALERKLDLCGWSNEREYRELLAPAFLGGEMPAMITWRPEEMAELAWERLELRAREPRTAACRIDVKVRLAEPRRAEDVLKLG
jgi:DNA-binding LacI/PurR family transcriptional regulator